MNIQKNVGTINALIRITLGLTMLSWSTAKLAKKPRKISYLFWAMMGAMKVAEGIVKYCPVTDVMKKQMENGNSLFGLNIRSNGNSNEQKKHDNNQGDAKNNKETNNGGNQGNKSANQSNTNNESEPQIKQLIDTFTNKG
ncbi:YgaP family membrane protein [Bacillus kwashiorkori]|uniref:YgaP family membrane protein n=1 Tax=Bacillus kwashiorkori TaxID=1522318 RepID=UPI0008F93C59|nr:DUF2892 domain-containing protein [Bacillus kwashiorkori]